MNKKKIVVASSAALLLLFLGYWLGGFGTNRSPSLSPEAKFEQVWAQNNLPEIEEEAIKSVAAGSGLSTEVNVHLISDENLYKTQSYYETELADRGWSYLTNTPPNRNHFTTEFRKEDQLVQVIGTTQPGNRQKTDIRINLRKMSPEEITQRTKSAETQQRRQKARYNYR